MLISELLEQLEYEEVIRIYNGNVEVQKDVEIKPVTKTQGEFLEHCTDKFKIVTTNNTLYIGAFGNINYLDEQTLDLFF